MLARRNICGRRRMKKHRFWAWAMIACLFMTVYTGYKHR